MGRKESNQTKISAWMHALDHVNYRRDVDE